MAALNRPVTATYTINETVRVDTQDNEDHTFCGIMFPIRAKAILPVDRIIIESVAVRGQLGDLTVWISNSSCGETPPAASVSSTLMDSTTTTSSSASFRLTSKHWTKVYQRNHKASPRTYSVLDLSASAEHLVLFPGQVRMIYIHSTLPSDTAIVYDNASTNMFGGGMNNNVSSIRFEDDKIAIHTGKAHLSFEPFGQEPIWGWGNAWRDRREFVGQIKYGTVYKLWNPDRHTYFGSNFQAATETLLMLQRRNTVISCLPDECLYYILNMCRWDWFDDTSRGLKQKYRNRKRLEREKQSQRNQVMDVQESALNDSIGAVNNSHAVVEPLSGRDYDDSMGSHAGGEDFDNMEQDEEVSDDDEDDDSDSNASAWERAHGYRADGSRFVFHVVSSDDESDNSDSGDENGADRNVQHNHHHHPWFGHRVARQLVVRALGRGDRAATGR